MEVLQVSNGSKKAVAEGRTEVPTKLEGLYLRQACHSPDASCMHDVWFCLCMHAFFRIAMSHRGGLLHVGWLFRKSNRKHMELAPDGSACD